jgi:hypothetical protein
VGERVRAARGLQLETTEQGDGGGRREEEGEEVMGAEAGGWGAPAGGSGEDGDGWKEDGALDASEVGAWRGSLRARKEEEPEREEEREEEGERRREMGRQVDEGVMKQVEQAILALRYRTTCQARPHFFGADPPHPLT